MKQRQVRQKRKHHSVHAVRIVAENTVDGVELEEALQRTIKRIGRTKVTRVKVLTKH